VPHKEEQKRGTKRKQTKEQTRKQRTKHKTRGQKGKRTCKLYAICKKLLKTTDCPMAVKEKRTKTKKAQQPTSQEEKTTNEKRSYDMNLRPTLVGRLSIHRRAFA